MYFYLAASLPYLSFAKGVRISREQFAYECEKWLSEEDWGIIQDADINKIHLNHRDPQAISEWKEFNRTLQEGLAQVRLAREHHAAERLTSVYKDIFEEDTPLLMEKEFERIRWDFISLLDCCYYADINWLVLYLYKVQILERLASFNKEQGRQIFDQLCEVSYGKE